MISKIFAVLLIGSLTAGCVRHGQVSSGINSGSLTREFQMGSDIHREILGMFRVVEEPVLNRYVAGISGKLALASNRRDLTYQVVILEDERIYAMHAPGGFVYITTGFFRFLNSEIELAGILAHEVGALQYVDPQFSTARRAFKHLTRVTSYVGPFFGSMGALATIGAVAISEVTGRRKSVEAQLMEADRRALQYLVQAGFDPQGLIDPLRRMQMKEPTVQPYLYDYLKSHPLSEKRLAALETSFSELQIPPQNFQAGRETYLLATESLRMNSVTRT